MEKTININGVDITVTKIPLGEYPKIIESLKGLAEHKDKFQDLSSASIFQALPEVLIVATPEVINLMTVITKQPREIIEKWGLDDHMKVLEAVFTINNYQYVYTTLKKAMGSIKTQKPVVQAANETGAIQNS